MKNPIIEKINGATVCLYPMKEVEAVTVIARFHAGSWYEGEKWGAHHLLEHVMLDGGTKYSSEEVIEIFKEENGLTTNGATGREILEFYVRAPRLRIKEGLSLLFDAVFHPLIRESDIALNKTVIAQEFKDKWSNPHTRYGRALEENLYGKSHAYTRDGMGEMEFVEGLTRSTLKKIHERFCVPKNLVVVAVGNFDKFEMTRLISEELNTIPTGKSEDFTISDSKKGTPYFYWNEDMLKVSIDITWQSDQFTEDTPKNERIAINIGKYILGGSARSRLFKELRTKRGWVYHAYAGSGFLPTQSWFSVNTSTDSEKAQDVYEILLSETKRLVTDGIPDEEFDRAKNFINMQTLIGFDSVSSIASKLMGDLFFEKQIYMPEELNTIVNKITKEDVIGHLQTIFTKDPIVSVMSKMDPKLRIQ